MFSTGISTNTQSVLESLSKLELTSKYYLAGGTAVALHLGHRLSFDLDFFSPNPENPEKTRNQLDDAGTLEIFQNDEGTFNGKLDNIKLSYFLFPYPLLKPTQEYSGVQIADLLDLACMKMEAIASRGSKRDFVDLFFIMKQYSLVELTQAFSKKYIKHNVSLAHTLKSMVYFADADNEPEPHMLVDYSWEAVKEFFESEVKQFSRKKLNI